MKRKIIKMISVYLIGSLLMGMTTPIEYKDTIERKIEMARIQGYSIEQGFIYEDGMIIDYIGENPEIVIPTELGGEKITSLASSAFKDNTLITNVTIPDSISIQILGDKSELFYGCINLESVILPSNMTSIPGYMFYNCSNLKSIDIPKGVKSIGEEAFYLCDSIYEMEIPFGVNHLGKQAFNGAGIVKLSIPITVMKMDFSVFEYCNKIEDITIDYGDESIDDITDVQWYDYVWGIMDNSFSIYNLADGFVKNNTEIKQVVDLTSTKAAIKTVTVEAEGIDDIVVGINDAYKGINVPSEIDTVTIKGLTYNNKAEVKNIVNKKINFGKNEIRVSSVAESGNIYTSIINIIRGNIEEDFEFNDGIITKYKGKNGVVVVPSTIGGQTVTTIGANAFRNNTEIVSIEIPDTVTSIEKGQYYDDTPFYGCYNLKYVKLSKNLTSIPDSLFYRCKELRKVDLPIKLTEIPNRLFYECNKLEDISIPNTVTSIKSNSFYGCNNLKSIVIPSSVKSLGTSIFYGCYDLTDIVIPVEITNSVDVGLSTSKQLEEITLDYGNEHLASIEDYQWKSILKNKIFTGINENNIKKIALKNNIEVKEVKSEQSSNNLLQKLIINGEVRDDIEIDLIQTSCNLEVPYEIEKVTIDGIAFNEKATINRIIDKELNIGYNQFKLSIISEAGSERIYTINILRRNVNNDFLVKDGVIISYIGEPDKVIIPEYINGEKIIGIGDNAFKDEKTIVSIVIPEGVTTIGENSFYGCINLNNIELPSTLTEIKKYAFYSSGISNITIPEGVKYIPSYGFSKCKNLRNINLPQSLTEIRKSAFDVSGIISIDIPESVTYIGSSAFSNCENLKYIKLPKGIKSLEYATFFNTNLRELVIPYGVTKIESSALPYYELESIEIPITLDLTYTNLNSIKDITINYGDNDIKDIDIDTWGNDIKGFNKWYCTNGYAKNNKSIKQVKGLAREMKISAGTLQPAFSENIKEYTLTVPSNYDKVTISLIISNDYALTNTVVKKLEEGNNGIVDLEAKDKFGNIITYNVKIIKDKYSQESDFSFRNGIISEYKGVGGNIVIPPIIGGEIVTGIGINAFRGNTKIKNIELPDGINKIEISAFKGCTNLKSINIPSTVKEIGSSAFENCISLDNVKIPSSIEYINTLTFGGCTSLSNIEIPSSVIIIGNSAFNGCTSLENVKIQYGLKNIYSYAFENCSNLSRVYIPKSVIYCDNNAFKNTNKLNEVIIDYGDEDISNVGLNEFNNFIVNNPGLSGINIDNITDGYIKNNSEIKKVKGIEKEDINNDGNIDINDISLISIKYNKSNEDSEWDDALDINSDGIIDVFDIILISKKIK